MFSNEVDRYDNKFLFFGGIGASLLAWMTTGSLWVLVGAIIIVSRECRRQELEQPQDVFDAAFQPLPLPPAEAPSPVTVNNAISTNVAVNLPVGQTVPFINIPEVQTAQSAPVATASTIVRSNSQGCNPVESIEIFEDDQTDGLPIDDLPQSIIDKVMSGMGTGHIFASCKSNSGKTTTLWSLMRKMAEAEPTQFLVIDPKGSKWLGLDERWICRPALNNISQILRWVKAANNTLNKRIEKRQETGNPTTEPRLVLIIDEWPTLYSLATKAKIADELLSYLEILLWMGRQDKVNLWIMGQSHLTKESGFSRQAQSGFDLMALGRGDETESLVSMISDEWVVRDSVRRKDLMNKLSQSIDKSNNAPIAFTSSGGGRLCRLPDYREFINWTIPKCQETNDGK